MSGYREVYDTLEQETVCALAKPTKRGCSACGVQRPHAGPVFFRGERITRRFSKTASPARPTRRSAPLPNPGYADMVVQGFETGLKWQLCRAAPGDEKHVICNADKGDPARSRTGVLTRTPKDVFLGMVVAAYAIGSRHGIVYLRAEYVYLRRYLESQLPGPRAGAAPSSRRWVRRHRQPLRPVCVNRPPRLRVRD